MAKRAKVHQPAAVIVKPRHKPLCPNWDVTNLLTMPFIEPRLVWESPESPGGRVIHGDCVSWMEGVEGRECYDLIFADPPFNIGREYIGMSDSIEWREYEKWTKSWLIAAYSLLRVGGVLYVHVPDAIAAIILRTMHFWEARQIQWVIWHYRFGQWTDSGFISSHTHGLVFTKPGKPHIWNPDDVLVPSDRALKYNDQRTEGTKNPGMRVPLDVWGADISSIDGQFLDGDGPNWGRVTGSHSNLERRPLHDNQLPERYLERIIRAWSNPGSWICDPFGGSGTTITVARALGRHCVTVEQASEYCDSIVERTQKGAVRV